MKTLCQLLSLFALLGVLAILLGCQTPEVAQSIAPDITSDVKALRAKAESGDAAAQFHLGYRHYHGIGDVEEVGKRPLSGFAKPRRREW